MISRSLFKSTIAYTIGNGLPMVASLILLPFYTNAFDPAEFGMLSLLISLTLFFYHFVNAAMDNYISVHYHFEKHDDERLKQLIGTVLFIQLCAGLVILLVMVPLGQRVMNLFMGTGTTVYYWSGFMCVVTAITTSILRVYQNVQIQEKRPRGFFLTSLVSSALMVLLCLWFLSYNPGDINGPLAGRMFAGLALAVFVVVRRMPIRISANVVRGWFSFSWPLVIMGASTWVIAYITPYILSHYVPAAEIGLYSLVLSLMLALDFFQNGLAASMYPVIFGDRIKRGGITPDEKGYHHLFSMINLLVIGLSLLVLPVLVYALVPREEYHQALVWLPLFAVSYVWRGPFSAGYSIALYNKNTRMLMENGLVSMVVQVGLIVWFTDQWGLTGALTGTIAGRMLQSLWLYYRSGAATEIRANPVKLLLSPLLLSLALAALFIYSEYFPPAISGLVAFAFSSLLVLLVYRRELPAAWSMARQKLSANQKSIR